MYVPPDRKTPRRQMQVSQGGVVGHAPQVLVRFREIVEEGNITGPYRGYLFYWKTTRKDAIDEIALALWPYLGLEKRIQFERMSRAAGRPLPTWPLEERSRTTEIAWATGLFDGEGSTSLAGPSDRPFVKLELSQSSATGVPLLLKRFQAAVAAGFIGGPYAPRNAWARLPQYRWSLGARDEVERVLELMWPLLSTHKRDQADRVRRRLRQ